MKFLEQILHPEGFEREVEFYLLPEKYQSKFYNFKYPYWFQWKAFVFGWTSLTPLTEEATKSLSKLVIGKRNPPANLFADEPLSNFAELKSVDGEERSRSVREMKIFINTFMGRASRREKRKFLRSMKRYNKETYGE